MENTFLSKEEALKLYNKNKTQGIGFERDITPENLGGEQVAISDYNQVDNFVKAADQSWVSQLGNMGAQMIGDIVGTTVAAPGTIWELISSVGKGTDDFNNAVIETGEDIKNWTRENFPIYRENPYAAFDIGDSGWWAEHGVSLGSSLSMLIPARGATALLGKVGKIAGIGKNINQGVKTLGKITTEAAVMRNLENFQESKQVVDETRTEALNLFESMDDVQFQKFKESNTALTEEQKQLDKEELANNIASKAGWQSYWINSSNIVFDFMQLLPIYKAKGAILETRAPIRNVKTYKAFQQSLGRKLDDISSSEIFRQRLNYVGGAWARQSTEGVEEIINAIGGKEGTYYGKYLLGTNVDQDENTAARILNYLEDPHVWEAGVWGVAGGVVFEKAATTFDNVVSKIKNGNALTNNELRRDEINSRGLKVKEAAAKLALIQNDINPVNGEKIEGQNEQEVLKNKETLINNLKANLATDLGLAAARYGNVDLLLRQIDTKEFKQDLIDSGVATEEDITKVSGYLKKEIETAEKLYKDNYYKLANITGSVGAKEIVVNANVRSAAQIELIKRQQAKFQKEFTETLALDSYYNSLSSEDKSNYNTLIDYLANKQAIKEINTIVEAQKEEFFKQNLKDKATEVTTKLQEAVTQNEELLKDIKLKPSSINFDLIKLKTEDIIHEYMTNSLAYTSAKNLTKEGVAAAEKVKEEVKSIANKNFVKDVTERIKNIDLSQDLDTQFSELEKWVTANNKNNIDLKNVNLDLNKHKERLKAEQQKLQKQQEAAISRQEKKVKQEEATAAVTELKTLTPVPEVSDEDASILAIPNLSKIANDASTPVSALKAMLNLPTFSAAKVQDYLRYKIYQRELAEQQQKVYETSSDIVDLNAVVDLNTNTTTEDDNTENNILFNAFINDLPRQLGPTVFTRLDKSANLTPNKNGFLVLNQASNKKLQAIYDAKIGTKVFVKVIKDSTDNRKDIPIGVYNEAGELLFELNDTQYLTQELELTNNLISRINTTSDLIEELWQHVTNYRNKDVTEEERTKAEEVLYSSPLVQEFYGYQPASKNLEEFVEHFVQLLLTNTTSGNIKQKDKVFDKDKISESLYIWFTKIQKDLEHITKIRATINANPDTVITTSIVGATSGSLIESKSTKANKNGVYPSIGHKVDEVFEETPLQIHYVDNGIITTKNPNYKRHGFDKNRQYKANTYYLPVKGLDGRYIPVYLKTNNVGNINNAIIYDDNFNKQQNDYANKVSDFVFNKVNELAELFNEGRLIQETLPIQQELNKVLVNIGYSVNEAASITKSPRIDFYKFGNKAKGYISCYLNKDGSIEVYEYELDTTSNSDKPTFLLRGKTTTEVKEKIKEYVATINRNINTKELDNPNPYVDVVDNTTYADYSEYLIKTGAFYTTNGKVVNKDGKFISNFTIGGDYVSNLGAHYNYTVVINATPEKVESLTDVSNREKAEKALKDADNIIDLGLKFKLNSDWNFIFALADSLGVSITKEFIAPSGIENAQFNKLTNTITLTTNWLNLNENDKAEVLAHEGLHAIIKEKLKEKSSEAIFKELKTFIDKLPESDSNPRVNNILNILRQKGKEEELITYAFTDNVFAKYLNSLEYEVSPEGEKLSFWTKLKEIIANIFGININDKSKLKELSILLDTIIDGTNSNKTNDNITVDEVKTTDGTESGEDNKGIEEQKPKIEKEQKKDDTNLFDDLVIDFHNISLAETPQQQYERFIRSNDSLGKSGYLTSTTKKLIQYRQYIAAKYPLLNIRVSNINDATIVSFEGFKDIMFNEVNYALKDIEEIFSTTPELSIIGTKKQYSQYLDTIFPDSKVKDIVYHSSKYKFENFDKSKLGSNTNPNKEFPQFNDSYLGFHFTSNPEYYRNRFEFGSKYEKNLNEYRVILNIQNPKDIADKDEFSQNNISYIKPEDVKNNDSIIYDYLDKVDFSKGEKTSIYTNNYLVFEPEQIHILGSKQDIAGFKEFVNNLMFNEVDYSLKSINLLQSDTAVKLFDKGAKNNWDLNKILTELQVPKEQRQIITNLDDKEFSFGGLDLRESIIASLLTNYSYTIEVNTAINEVDGDRTNYWFENPKYFYSFDHETNKYYKYSKETNARYTPLEPEFEISKEQYFKELKESQTPTQHYSNLTVPGGTNYTENEIATPAITPSIKGHSQFATDKGIGWFRSDEQLLKEDIIGYEETYDLPFANEDKVLGTPSTKTRRILEVQSDLFQKGRDEKKLNKQQTPKYNNGDIITNDKGTFEFLGYFVTLENKEYVKLKNIKTGEEGIVYQDAFDKKNTPKTDLNANNFLQLLNKDNTWVTFFIKSIIQDSAKKGYEKVLFPSGNTASKVEGHTTLEEFKKQKEDRIELLEKDTIKNKQALNDGYYLEDYKGLRPAEKEYLTDTTRKQTEETIIRNDKEIEQLKQELQRIETEGFGALKPIYNFYENTVTNILNKTYGKDTIQVITDEYGNTWNELTIDKSRDLNNILFNEVNYGEFTKEERRHLEKTTSWIIATLLSTKEVELRKMLNNDKSANKIRIGIANVIKNTYNKKKADGQVFTKNQEVLIDKWVKDLSSEESQLWFKVKNNLASNQNIIISDEQVEFKEDSWTKRWDDTKLYGKPSKDNVNKYVKYLYSTAIKLDPTSIVTTKEGKIEYKPDTNTLTGFPEPIDYSLTYNQVSQFLVNSSDKYAMLSKLYDLSNKIDKSLLQIYNKLIEDEDLLNGFYASSDRDLPVETMVLVNDVTGKTTNGEEGIKVKIANTAGLPEYRLADAWLHNISKYIKGKRLDINILNNNLVTLDSLNIESNLDVITDNLHNIYNYLGVDVKLEALKAYVTFDNKSDVINKLKYLLNATISIIKDNKDFKSIQNESNNVLTLAKATKEFHTFRTESMYKDVNNENIYGLQLPSYLYDWFKLFNTPDALYEMLSTTYAVDPAMQYSNILWANGTGGFLNYKIEQVTDAFGNINSIKVPTSLNIEGINRFKKHLMGGGKNEKTGNSQKYTEIIGNDWKFYKLVHFFKSQFKKADKLVVSFPMLSPSDKGTTNMIATNKVPVTIADLKAIKNGTHTSTVIFNSIKNTVLQEVKRMQYAAEYMFEKDENNEFKKDSLGRFIVKPSIEHTLVNHYHFKYKNGKKVYYDGSNLIGKVFKFHNINLNNILTNILDKNTFTSEDNAKIDNAILEFIDEQTSKAKVRYISYKEQLENMVKISYDVAISEFILNQYLFNVEQQNLWFGNSAFYKDYTDTSKRAPQVIASGTTNALNGGVTCLTIADINIKGTFYNKEQDEDINIGDGQSYITIDEFEKRIKGWGLYKEFKSVIDKLKVGQDVTLEEAESMRLLQSQKNFYYKFAWDNTLKFYMPVQVKNSEFILSPTVISNNTELTKLYNLMIDNNIGQINFESAHKMGIKNIVKITDDAGNILDNIDKDIIEKGKYTLDYKHLKLQLEVPEALKDYENKAGSQINRKILDNLRLENSYLLSDVDKSETFYTGEELKNHIQELWSANIKDSAKLLAAELGIKINRVTGEVESTVDNEILLEKLKTIAETKNVNKNDLYALQLVDGEFIVPLSYSVLADKWENYLTALFTNNVINQKFSGFHAAQVSNAFFRGSKPEVLKSSEAGKIEGINWLTRKENNYRLNHTIVTDKTNVNGLKTIEKAEILLPAWTEKLFKEGERIDINTMSEELRTMLGYRIPTEGKYSMVVMEVVGFLPEAYGSTIVLPDDFVLQSGTDFDIDSLYAMTYEFFTDENDNFVPYVYNNKPSEVQERYDIYKRNNKLKVGFAEFNTWSIEEQNTREARNNRILSSYISILSDIRHFEEEVVVGSQFSDIKSAKDYIEEILKEQAVEINPTTDEGQEIYRSRAIDGRGLKGISVNSDTFLSVAQLTNMYLSVPVVIGIDNPTEEDIKKYIKLYGKNFLINKDKTKGKILLYNIGKTGNKSNINKDGKLISAYVAQTTANILDNVKFPLYKSINSFTFGVFKMFPMLSWDYTYATLFVSQPIINELSDEYFSTKGVASTNKASEIYNKVRNKYTKALADITPGLKIGEREKITLDKGANLDDNKLRKILGFKGVEKTSFVFTQASLENLLKYNKTSLGSNVEKDRQYYLKQLQVLELFEYYNKEIVKHIDDGIRYLSTDKTKVGPELENVNILNEQIGTAALESNLLIDGEPAVIKILPSAFGRNNTKVTNSFEVFPEDGKSLGGIKVEEFSGFWTREQVAKQTDKVFLFGDNIEDAITGYVPTSTQAVIRGLPNAIGIATKRDRKTVSNPNDTDSYFHNTDYAEFKDIVDKAIQKAKDSGKIIVIPADGIGTGKAMLKEKAPKLFEYLQQQLIKLKNSNKTNISNLYDVSSSKQIFPEGEKSLGSTENNEDSKVITNTYTLEESKYKTLDAYYKYGFKFALNALSPLFITQSRAYTLLRSKYRFKSEKFIKALRKYANAYILKDLPFFKVANVDRIYGQNTPYILDLDITKEENFEKYRSLSPANKLDLVKLYFKEQFEGQENTHFIHFVDYNVTDTAKGYQVIEFETADNVDDMIDTFEELLTSSNVFIKDMAEDLVKYNYYVHGLSFNSSYAKIIPLKWMNEVLNIGEYYRNKQNELNENEFYFDDNFTDNFYMSNWKTGAIVPTAYDLKLSEEVETLSSFQYYELSPEIRYAEFIKTYFIEDEQLTFSVYKNKGFDESKESVTFELYPQKTLFKFLNDSNNSETSTDSDAVLFHEADITSKETELNEFNAEYSLNNLDLKALSNLETVTKTNEKYKHCK